MLIVFIMKKENFFLSLLILIILFSINVLAIEFNNTNTSNDTTSNICLEDWFNTETSKECFCGKQETIFIDLNECGTEENKPSESKECGCQPNWNCTSWSECINGEKTRECKDTICSYNTSECSIRLKLDCEVNETDNEQTVSETKPAKNETKLAEKVKITFFDKFICWFSSLFKDNYEQCLIEKIGIEPEINITKPNETIKVTKTRKINFPDGEVKEGAQVYPDASKYFLYYSCDRIFNTCNETEKMKSFCNDRCTITNGFKDTELLLSEPKEILQCICNTEEPKPCYAVWRCTGWEDCRKGIRKRDCYDVNFCGTDYNKPELEEAC